MDIDTSQAQSVLKTCIRMLACLLAREEKSETYSFIHFFYYSFHGMGMKPIPQLSLHVFILHGTAGRGAVGWGVGGLGGGGWGAMYLHVCLMDQLLLEMQMGSISD